MFYKAKMKFIAEALDKLKVVVARDFSDIQHLQSSFANAHDFTLKTFEKIERILVKEVRQSFPFAEVHVVTDGAVTRIIPSRKQPILHKITIFPIDSVLNFSRGIKDFGTLLFIEEIPPLANVSQEFLSILSKIFALQPQEDLDLSMFDEHKNIILDYDGPLVPRHMVAFIDDNIISCDKLDGVFCNNRIMKFTERLHGGQVVINCNTDGCQAPFLQSTFHKRVTNSLTRDIETFVCSKVDGIVYDSPSEIESMIFNMISSQFMIRSITTEAGVFCTAGFSVFKKLFQI